jgi:hypothetical protein
MANNLNKNTYGKRYFRFDLLPRKSEDEIQELEVRDNTLLYSFLLIFFSAVVFFILTLVKVALVDPALAVSNNNVVNAEKQIRNFSQIQKVNGELYVKSTSLEPLLGQDVKTTKFLDFAEKFKTAFAGRVDIQTYLRESDGLFSMNLGTISTNEVQLIVQYLEDQEGVEDIFIKNLDWSTENDLLPVTIQIKFKYT